MVNLLLYLSSRVDPGKGERCRLSMLSDNTIDNSNHTWPTDNATESKHQLTIRILIGTQQLLATNCLYRDPAVINKEQSLKTYLNLLSNT